MFRTRTYHRIGKGFLSLLLVFAVMLSLAVPFDLTVSAEDEEPATGGDIHCFVYTALDDNGNAIKYDKDHYKYDIIFQKGGDAPYPDRQYVLHVDNFDNDEQTNAALGIGKKEEYKQPWYDYNYYCHRLIIKDRIKPRKMSGWFMYMKNLADANVSGLEDKIDTSICTSFYCTFNYCYLKNLDLTQWDMSSATTVNGMFSHQDGRGLQTLNISTWELPNCTNFGAFIYDSLLEELDISSLNPQKCTSMASAFAFNKKLKRIVFPEHFRIGGSGLNLNNMFESDVSLEELDLSSWEVPNPRYCSSMFINCTSLTSINFEGSTWGAYSSSTSTTYNNMFEGCVSLESIKASHMVSFLDSPSIFKGCTALKEIDLSYLGTVYANQEKNATLNGKANIYEGCDELSWVKLGAGYVKSGKAGTSVPSKGVWTKIDEPNKGMKLSAEDLFLKFGDSGKGEAGIWVADSSIAFKGNGGSPDSQFVSGNKGIELEFDEEALVASRSGYRFNGWWTEKEEGEGTQVHSGFVPEQWSYYAHWNENSYQLILNGNGGTATVHNDTTGEDEEVDEITADDDLLYSEYYELNNSIFSKEGYILSGWNTRPNGTGDSYSANDSVSKMTATNGGEAKLYAQWHKPDFVLRFDAQGGEAVADKTYTFVTGKKTYYGDLAETTRNGYTFDGWWTAASGGTRITKTTEVNTANNPLYAHWKENPTVTFDANGAGNAYFDDDTAKTSLTKYYKYGQNLGVLPTPYFGASALDGWYTAASGGTRVDRDTPATVTTTYYAHWGYKPQFDSNGGVYTSDTVSGIFPTYTLQTASDKEHPEIYTIYKTSPDPVTGQACPMLPEFMSVDGFEGWYFGDRNLTNDLQSADSVEIDLSSGTHVAAHWAAKTVYKVTLNLGGGAFASSRKNPIEVYAGNAVEELPVPVRSGYDFLGWYTEAEGGGKKDYTFVPASDCTLYAHWAQKNLTVTFDPNGGTLFLPQNSTVKVASGGSVKTLPGANREGYTLDGWYTNADGTGTKLTDSVTIDADTTYYAKWSSAESRFITSSDGLYKYSVKWVTPSNEYVTNVDDNLIVTPQNGGSGASVMLLVEFDFDQAVAAQSTPGKVLGADTVQIKIPKFIFMGADGNGVGSNNIGNGLSKTDTETSNFIYDDTSDPDYYIIKNNDPIDGSKFQNQVFKISYSLTAAQLRSINGGYLDENGNYAGNYYNRDIGTDPLTVNINVNQSGVATTDYTKELGIEVHSKTNTTAAKAQADASFGWNNAWGTKPADADQYYYITWYLTSSHDTASSQKFKVEWSEAPVHQGSVVYTKAEGGDKFYESGTFRTVVVTKHLRKSDDSGWKNVYNEAVLTVTSLSGHKEQYRVSKTAGVYIIPSGYGTKFDKTIKDYESASRVKEGAQELIANRTGYDYLPFSITYCEYKNTDNDKQWYENTKTYSTKERNIVITDGAKGSNDVVISSVKGSSPYNWNATVDDPTSALVGDALGDADYRFNTLDLYITEYDAVRITYTNDNEEQVTEWSEPYQHDSFADYDDIEVWTRAEGSSSFTLFKTVKTSELTATDSAESKYGVAKASVALPGDTVGYRIVHKSSFYTTKIVVNPNLCLKSSNKVYDFVKTDIAAGRRTLIKNKCTMSVDNVGKDSRDNGENGAYPCSYELTVGESTIYVAQRCDPAAKYVTTTDTIQELPAVISGWGTTSSVDASNKNVLRYVDSGVFYDLLPAGFTVDKSTVFVKARVKHQNAQDVGAGSYDQEKDSKNFPSGYYSVELIENWQNSGRTMMKVTVNTPDDIKTLLGYTEDTVIVTGYNVFFKMKTPLANILANGEKQTNHVCFIDTTENQNSPKYKNNPISTGLDDKSRPYFKDLDSEYTAFANGLTTCISPVQYATGATSSVRTEGVLMFDDETVGLNSNYVYDVSFTNGNQPAKDIIIYDVIENSLTGSVYDWHGEFQSVDISGIGALRDFTDSDSVKIYCNPKVFYCITDEAITREDLDITNTAIWTDIKPSGSDLLRVKAIAVDCRKNTKGGDFTLPADGTGGKKSSITFNINMKSPQSNSDNDVATYNEAFVSGTMSAEPFTNVTLTKVMLHFLNPEFHKISFPDSGTSSAASDRVGVVNNSTIEYYLSFTNPDEHVNINNIVVEDLLDSNLILTSTVKVKIGDETPIAIDKHARISAFAVSTESGRAKFTATISSLAPGETMTIIIPATVNIDPSIDVEATTVAIDNSAAIISVNGNDAAIPSETTYHKVTVCKAKIKKVDINGEGLAGATLQILNKDKTQVLHEFTSTADVYTTNLSPGEYVLREISTPDDDAYKKAQDVSFTIDVEGIHYVGGEKISYVEMKDEPAYRIVFHENQPGHDDAVFKVYGPGDIKNNGYKINHFYDIPEWAGDEYVFAGWYFKPGFGESADFDSESTVTAVSFDSQTYPKSDAENPQDYHLYAKWIEVGTVEQATGENGDTNNYGGAPIRGFGLAGVQIRDPGMGDHNYNNEEKPQGLRFVTTLSESLFNSIKRISSTGVEYGYVVGTEANINSFIKHYGITDTAKYKLQYKGDNVNGVNTNPAKGEGTAKTDFRYITNVNCTSKHGNASGIVTDDHQNFDDYRLYTLVVTYEGEQEKKSEKIDARAYLRYTDANGKIRVFYNDYSKNKYYGGCLCSFNQVSQIAIPTTSES